LDIVATMLGRDPRAKQALVGKRLDHVHRWGCLRPGREVEDRFSSLERKTAVENRALGEGGLLPLSEQVPRPVDRRTQRGLARRRAAGTGKELEAIAHPRDELCGGEEGHPS